MNIFKSIDGNQFCARIGVDLQDGISGFGDTPELAMEDLVKSLFEALKDSTHVNTGNSGSCGDCEFNAEISEQKTKKFKRWMDQIPAGSQTKDEK